ncbi:MAG: hypothetical protein M3319_13370 [Actinomycetota bacterium]|nr:hypothetical protein [Actinomycetota bacterium]MDQ3901372.1 hypothetical protein [Actinomycetota bacterium]
MIEQPTPSVQVVRVTGELDMLTTPLLEAHVQGASREAGDTLWWTCAGSASLELRGWRVWSPPRRPLTVEAVTGADHRIVARPLDITSLRAGFDIHPTVDSIASR